MENKIKDMLEIISKGEATISIKKGKGLNVEAKGSRLAILLALASTEQHLLNELDCNNEEFNVIKQITQTVGKLNE